jgi:hypothetical protein
MSKDLKYTTQSFVFIAYINLTKRGLPYKRSVKWMSFGRDK